MASIKISALSPLELDRLTDNDVFIVNDQDATTQKITFKTIKDGLDRDPRNFTGPVEFDNTVIFNGPLGGRNVYTKDETLNEITLALEPVISDVDDLEAGQTKIKNLLGQAAKDGAAVIPASRFVTPHMRNSGPYMHEQALIRLDAGTGLAIQSIESNLALINSISARLGDLDRGIATDPSASDDGRVTIAERDIALLQDIVGVGGQNITDNENNITQNANYITNLHTMVGATEGDTDMVPAFATAAAPIAGKANLTAALEAVNANVILNTTEIGLVDDKTVDNSTVNAENHAHIRELLVVIQTACSAFSSDGSKTTADQLAADISTAIADAITGGTLPSS